MLAAVHAIGCSTPPPVYPTREPIDPTYSSRVEMDLAHPIENLYDVPMYSSSVIPWDESSHRYYKSQVLKGDE